MVFRQRNGMMRLESNGYHGEKGDGYAEEVDLAV